MSSYQMPNYLVIPPAPPNSRFRLEQKESRAKRVKTMISVHFNTIGEDIELTRTLSYIEWLIFLL